MTILEFNREYDQLALILGRFATSLTRDREEAKDLLQETAYRAFWNRTKFAVGTNFKAWIMTIMRNTYISAYRKRRSSIVQSHAYDFDPSSSKRLSVANTAPSSINHEAITGILDELDELYSTPFRMFYAGYRYEEIAEYLDVPMGTVKSRIFCARQKLRRQITEAGLR